VFVLRLEDTDRERSKPEHVDSILEAMEWLGLDHDEGPFYQTQRFDRYEKAVEGLLAQGRAYWCHCSPEELKEKREKAMKAGGKPMYDGCCRDKDLEAGPGAVVRFKGPRTGSTAWSDLVKGPISWENEEMDDLIIWRSDGSPTYHLAVVVDDIDMGMTHIIRGDDHVANTPRQILLYQAMEADLPKFAHIPMILGPDKAKLSKRHGATSVVDYRDMGYLPEAMLNTLARLGWSHGDQEMFSRDELIKFFGLDSVGKSAAVFDQDKLLKMNQRYMQAADAKRLGDLVKPFLSQRGKDVAPDHEDMLIKAIPELTPRTPTLNDLAEWAEPYIVDLPEMDPKARKKFLKPENSPILASVKDLVAEKGVDDTEAMEQAFRDLAEEKGLKLGKVAQPVRVALVGRTASPGIFEVMELLGQEKVLARLAAALEIAKNPTETS
jgi:glutamyl-tRNA synthetase